jgi:hypothetical protein
MEITFHRSGGATCKAAEAALIAATQALGVAADVAKVTDMQGRGARRQGAPSRAQIEGWLK